MDRYEITPAEPSSWSCKAEQIAALTGEWQRLSVLPGDENPGTRNNQYESLCFEGLAERKVERGFAYFRLARVGPFPQESRKGHPCPGCGYLLFEQPYCNTCQNALNRGEQIFQDPAPGSPQAEGPNLCPGVPGRPGCQPRTFVGAVACTECREGWNWPEAVAQAAQAIRTLSSLPREVVIEASAQKPVREPVSMEGLRKQRDGLADALEAIRGEIAKTYGPDRAGADACVTWIDDCAWVALRRIGRAFAIFALLWALGWPAFAQTIFGPARVIDGDTLEVAGQKVRLHGVDAPELRQICTRPEFNGHSGSMENSPWACGVAARGRLEELIDGRPVTCQPLDKDRYGRVVARCYVDLSVGTPGRPHAHMDLGGWMVRQGYAVAYTKYSRDYLPQEAVARGAKLGLWSGSFVAPAEWRKGVR